MFTFKDTNSRIGIVPKLYLGFALVALSVLVVIGFAYKQSLDESNAIKSSNHIYQVMTETDTLLTSLLNMETGMRGFSLAGIESFLEPYNEGQSDFKTHFKTLEELTRDNPGQQVKLAQLRHVEEQWAKSARVTIEKRRSVTANQASMADIIETEQTMQVKGYMDGMRNILEGIYAEELGLIELRATALQESAQTAKQVAIVGGSMAVFFAGLFVFFVAADYRERKKVAEKFQEMNSDLQDINATLEEEIMERQEAQKALQYLNFGLEKIVAERTGELQDINGTLEEEVMDRQAAQEALQSLNHELENIVAERTGELQDINATLEEEIMERQAAQEALQNLNLDLENIVMERTGELQDINATLEEEIMERQTAQETLQDLNTRLEDEATQRQAAQEALQELNIKLEYEATQRQAAQKALQDLNIKLEDEATQRQAAQEALQDLNIKLEDEATQRQAAQKALQDLNLGLENIVAERTGELQDINKTLEEEVMERQVAQNELAQANAHLEARVQERTNQLQEINATLEEEIMERQATEEALQESRNALLVREQQLEYYADDVVATNTELKSFVNTIAHDFRSPMVNLMGFSTELGNSLAELKEIIHESEAFLPKEVQVKVNELLETDMPEAQTFIKSAVTRLSRMVDALLNLSRLGRREMRYEEVDMSKLVNTIIQSFNHQITEQHIQVEVGNLPKIKIDYLVMEQIIGNLVDNAIKYLDPSRPGKIESSCTENDNEYVVSVKDNGRGIHDTDHENIFDLFRRSGNQDQPGEGMGLAYVRTLMRKLGGKVWCESELGVGTKISFTLPKSPRFQ